LDVVVDWIQVELAQIPKSHGDNVDLVRKELGEIMSGLKKTLASSESSSFRRQLVQLVRIIQATCLLRSDTQVSSPFIRIHLVPQTPSVDPTWLPFLDAVLD
jgi:hypothetical protein